MNGLVLAVSQAIGPNYLVWYSILCALTASVGTWVVHFTSYLWHNVFEEYILQERSSSLKVHCAVLSQCDKPKSQTRIYNADFTSPSKCMNYTAAEELPSEVVRDNATCTQGC